MSVESEFKIVHHPAVPFRGNIWCNDNAGIY